MTRSTWLSSASREAGRPPCCARAITLARKRAEHLPRTLPVLLSLTGCVAQVNSNPRVRLAAVINASLAERHDAPPGWFEDKLAAGECVVLLDGLDEVAGVRDRQRVATWIQEQRAIYSRNDFLVTSRPYAYRASLLPAADQLQLRELTQDQVDRFIRNWYGETGWQDGPARTGTRRTSSSEG